MNDRRHSTTLAIMLAAWFAFPAHSTVRAQDLNRFDDQKIIQVDLKTQADLDAVARSGAVIMNCVPGIGPMDVLVTPEQYRAIERLGRPIRLIVDDVQARLDAQRPVVSRADPFTDFFLDYHEYGDAATTGTIVWYMNELVSRHPTRASILNAGTTLEGRTIWGLRITNDAIADKPAVFYFSGEHAREWITPTAPLYLATHLLDNYGTDPEVTDLVDNVEFLLVPVMNVDGYVYTWTTNRMWRKNRRNNGDGTYGVDLNRNWGYAWGWDNTGSSPYSSDETYRGPSAFSEPETQAFRDFFYAHPNVRASLDIHSYSQLILWPWGYIPDFPPDQDVYAEVGYAMQSLIYDVHGQQYAAGPIATAIYPVNGGSVDWTYAEQGILSFSYELRPLGAPYFELPAGEIIPNNEEILPAMLHLTGSEWVNAPLRFRFPDGVPTTITAGTDTAIPVDIIEQFETVEPGSQRLMYRYYSTDPFMELPLTSTGGDSYTAVLPATNCTSTPEFYFSATGSGGTLLTSPQQAPADGFYSTLIETGRAAFFEEDLSANPGWSMGGSWGFGQPTGGGGEYGNPDPTSGYTGNNVYGYNLFGDYSNSLPERHLTSLPIDCTGRSGVRLSFWRWLGVEQPAYDHAYVRVSNNGTDWVTVWENQAEVADSSWLYQEFDIAAVADDQSTVYLRWTMGSTDGGWRYCGWNIDDISLTAGGCEGIAGDYNGDGAVDGDDFSTFAACFTGPAGPVSPGCSFFDFDADDDVECDDWTVFKTFWSGPEDPPVFSSCELFSDPTPDGITKNRYLSFTPGTSLGAAQAFRLTIVANPLFPASVGMQKWVGPPDGNGAARLQCDPEYRVWPQTPVHVSAAGIVPGASYGVEATLDGVGFLASVTMASAALWGDVVGPYDLDTQSWPGPDGSVDFTDIPAVVDSFRAHPQAPTSQRCDLYPALTDFQVDFDDITMVVDAFRGLPYPFGGPIGCP